MPPKIRSKPAAPKKKDEEQETSKPAIKKLDASVDNPPQVFILPRDTSSDARIATIPNPSTDVPNRYLVCPERGFYEFTKVAAPKSQQRSWLLAPDGEQKPDASERQEKDECEDEKDSNADVGYVLQAPDMLVATPVDPLFLLLPSLAGDGKSIGQEYLASSDYISSLMESSRQLSQVLQPRIEGHLGRTVESRLDAVCDCMDMGEEKMYALSLPKLVKELVSKAKRMTSRGLPASLEERFVKQALGTPVLSIKREESSISIATDDSSAGAESQSASEAQSQETDASGTTTATVSTSATSVSVGSTGNAQSAPEEITNLLRLRIAINFITTSYLSPALRTRLEPVFSDKKITEIDFSPLDKHLAHIASLKKEAQALRSLSDNISRKRSTMDDDEAIGKAEAKKRKKEEEEKNKKNVSLGIKKLAKADTSGMKKMSSFFTTAPAKR
ncbi:ribonuclease subunit b [Lecanosticta acicola]|uniref:Ribonuclease H2 subunit B n=1 Tax=Lecanosticta acicola TaxID=111012 RepID=A0AAI8YVE6_9PEZI|nr:ribonuclease subunit b [Lecanosticta acicola]